MTDAERRKTRREQQSREVEASQANLRENIAEAKRLVTESDTMLRRHQTERDQDEAAGSS